MQSGVITVANLQRVLGRGDEIVTAINRAMREKVAEIAECIVDRLKLISGAERVEVEVTDGRELLHEANDVFAWIDPDFTEYGCNVEAHPTEKTAVQVYEMVKDGTFAQIFDGIGINDNLDKLCLTQHQIKRFVQDHRKWLRTGGYATFFLFKAGGKFFVAHVRLYDDRGLEVHVFRLGYGNVWHAEYRLRFVILKLAISLPFMAEEFC